MTQQELARRKKVIYWGGAILCLFMFLGTGASFVVYRQGFADAPAILQEGLASFAALVALIADILLLFGFTRALSTGTERTICFIGSVILTIAACINIVTGFCILTNTPLAPFQLMWVQYGGTIILFTIAGLIWTVAAVDPIARATTRAVRTTVNTTRRATKAVRSRITYQ